MTHFELINELENYSLDGLKDLQHRLTRLIDEAEREEEMEEEAAETEAKRQENPTNAL